MPVGAGFVDVTAGARNLGPGLEAFVRGEAGWHFMPGGSAYGFGEAALTPGLPWVWQVGAGLRVDF